MTQPNKVHRSEAPPPEYDPSDDAPSKHYQRLLKELAPYKLPPDDVLQLDRWLSHCSAARRLERILEPFVVEQTRADQVKLCAKLKKCAEFISSNLDFLHQTSPLDSVLANRYCSMADQDLAPPTPAKDWLRFRDRLHADAAHLARVAKEAHAELATTTAKKGRERQAWRSIHFTELFDRLEGIGIKPRGLRLELATSIWNAYFQDAADRIMETEAADKIIRRQQARRKAQGQ